MTDYMTSLVGVVARQQVLVSITLPPSLRIPPRSGCLAAARDRAVLWPKQAGDPVHRLEGPVLVVSWTDNQALVEGAAVCGCGWTAMLENAYFQLVGRMGVKRAKKEKSMPKKVQGGMVQSLWPSHIFRFVPCSEPSAICIFPSVITDSPSWACSSPSWPF